MATESLDNYSSGFFSNWQKARKGKAKHLHDLRVSSRRIAAALEILVSLSGDDGLSRLRRRFRKLTRRIGRLRDLHVQQILAKEMQTSKELEAFRSHLDGKEKDEADRIRQVLKNDERKTLLRKLRRLQKALESGAFKRSRTQTRKAVLAVVRKRSEKLQLALKELNDDNMASVHPARIAFKKLRYVHESAAALFGPEYESDTKELQQYQTELGDIRDMEMVRKELFRWSRKQSTPARERVRPIDLKLRNQVESRLNACVQTIKQKATSVPPVRRKSVSRTTRRHTARP